MGVVNYPCTMQVTSGPVTILPGNSDDANKADIETCLKLNLDAQVSVTLVS